MLLLDVYIVPCHKSSCYLIMTMITIRVWFNIFVANLMIFYASGCCRYRYRYLKHLDTLDLNFKIMTDACYS